MGRSQIFPSNHCLLLLLLAELSCAQYEHWPYPEPAPQVFQPPQRAPNVPKIQLRLAGQKRKHNEGRVEVFYGGEWGTVCDDDFSIHAAHVVCRELGYLEAVSWLPGSKYGKGEGEGGLEQGIGFFQIPIIPGFSLIDASFPLVSRPQNMNIQVEDIRIRAILATYRKRVPVTEGYVEVKDEGSWKQICDKHWTMKNSRVVCGMFGFPSERKFNTNVYKMFASRRKQHYWPYSMECSGSEAHISSCRLGSPAGHNSSCAGGVPAVVSCVPGRAFAPGGHGGFRKAFRQEQPLVRLKGGANTGEGRVEVLKNGEWGTVCDDNWNLVSASVVCRELGFGSAREAIAGARLGQGERHSGTWMGKHRVGPDRRQRSPGLHWNEGRGRAAFRWVYGLCVPQLRLSGGRTPYEGRVEVLAERNGTLRWGTVCSHNWGTVEAMVVCRQLGLGFASHAFQETWYWHGDVSADDVVMSGVKCSGTEMSLSHCRHDGAHVSCPRGGGRFGAGVSCSETAPDLVLNAELVEQTAYLEDRPMFLLQCALEENCLASSAHNTSLTSGYRRLLRFSSQIHNNGQSDFRPKNGRHAWVWHDCHRHYHSMEVFTHYDLLNLNGTKVAEGHKASFCLEDTECEADVQKQYECANFGEQGITVGCWDVYRHDIDCQWIDITDVPPGDYLFQVVINPNYEVAESDYSNNVMKCRSRYDGQRIWMYNCHIGGSFSEETEQKFDHFRGLTNNNVSAR
ncbi:LOXL2 oxidase, partial [Copsychus sechellarum]|nr:LOXL2 oxidase [Copsychus sechellarum]